MKPIIATKFVAMDLDALIAALPPGRQSAIRQKTLEMELEILKNANLGLPEYFPASGARLVAVMPDGKQVELHPPVLAA